MKKIIMILMSLILMVGCTTVVFDEDKLKDATIEIVDKWVNHEEDILFSKFSDQMVKALPQEMMPLLYEQVFGVYENYISTEFDSYSEEDGHASVIVKINFENGYTKVNVVWNGSDEINGLFVTDKKIDQPLVTNEVELPIKQDKPLDGRLIEASEDHKTVVLIVSGSGPSDMDGSYAGSKIYRDIAVGLANEGIDSYRFNKRTYQYQQDMVALDYKMSVDVEILNDVKDAIRMLSSRGYENIYVLGHSLGGMLSLSIANNNELVDGVISMAGSLRGLEEIIYDQNMDIINQLQDEKTKEDYIKQITKEQESFNNRKNEDESLIIFGMSNYYWDSLQKNTGVDLVADFNKPILVVQGKEDAQVYYDKDYPLWQEHMSSKDLAMIAYDGLNHRFMKEGSNVVDTQVIEDIANWLKNIVAQ